MIRETRKNAGKYHDREFFHSASWQNLVEWTWTRSGDATGIFQASEIRDNIWSLAYVDALAMQAVRSASGNGQDASRTYPIHDATFNVTALVTKSSRRCPPGSDHFPSITSSIFAPLLNSTIAFTFACCSAK